MSESAIATAYSRVFPNEPFPGADVACRFLVAEILVSREILAGSDGVMRSKNDLQHAHDLVVGALCDPILGAALSELDTATLHSQAAVLCWALRHDHNQVFGSFLTQLKTYLRSMGVAVTTEKPE